MRPTQNRIRMLKSFESRPLCSFLNSLRSTFDGGGNSCALAMAAVMTLVIMARSYELNELRGALILNSFNSYIPALADRRHEKRKRVEGQGVVTDFALRRL